MQLRKKGSITIDNELYGRYAGEMQVAVHDLPVDEKVNVVGMVVEEDISLLPYVGAGKMFQLLYDRVKACISAICKKTLSVKGIMFLFSLKVFDE